MSRNRRFDLDESSQLLIRAHNETPSVANARQQQYLAPVIVGGRDQPTLNPALLRLSATISQVDNKGFASAD